MTTSLPARTSPGPDPLTAAGRRPLSVFLSHYRGDAGVLAALQRELRFRGVHAWRDATNLEYGSDFEVALRRAIREEVSAFIAYVTPQFLTRPVIWGIEVPEALERHRRDARFQIIPVFRGVTPAQLTRRCAEVGLDDLGRFHGEVLPARASAARRANALKTVARKTLRAGLTQRLGGAPDYVPRLLLRAQAYAAGEAGVDLDLDWTEPFAPGCPTPEEWEGDLLPALRDLRDAVGATSPRRRLHVEVQARLPAAIALGETFSSTAKYALDFGGANGAWSTDAPRRPAPVLERRDLAAAGTDRRTALVEVSIARRVGRTVAAHAAGLDVADAPGRAVRLEAVGGAGPRAVEDGSWAVSAAWEVGECLRELHDGDGVRHVHLYVAAPAEWCVLLGHTLNAVGRITVHQWHPATGEYVRACTLGATGTPGVAGVP